MALYVPPCASAARPVNRAIARSAAVTIDRFIGRGPFIARIRTRVGRTAGVMGLAAAAGVGWELAAVESALVVEGRRLTPWVIRLTPWAVRQPPPGGRVLRFFAPRIYALLLLEPPGVGLPDRPL